MQVRIKAQVWRFGIHIGALLPRELQRVHHPVLDGLRAKPGVANVLATAMKIHRQGASWCKMLTPGNACHHIAHLLGGLDHAFPGQQQNDAVG